MKRVEKKSIIVMFISIFIILFLTCDFAPYEGKENVAIDLGDIITAESSTEGARVLGAPQDAIITSIVISVSGPGVNKVSYTYNTPQRFLYIYVPPGEERIIELRLNVDPSSKSAVLAFGGETTISLKPGQFQCVQIQMAPVRTKLVIPDYNNLRVVQINDISGSNWDEIGGVGNPYNPYDVDFDRSGRIFVAKNAVGIADDIIRIDNIDEVNRLNINTQIGGPPPVPINSVNSIAIDNTNNILYFTNGSSSIYYFLIVDPLPAVPTVFEIPLAGTLSSIQAISVDKEGEFIYIAAMDSINDWAVFRYEIQTTNIISFKDTYFDALRDIIVKGDDVYVANLDGSDNYKIVKLNRNLQPLDGYGIYAPTVPNTNPGMFYGPRRFVAVLNKKLTIIDDREWDNADKLVSMSDINGTNWQTYGSTGNGVGQFNFFYYC